MVARTIWSIGMFLAGISIVASGLMAVLTMRLDWAAFLAASVVAYLIGSEMGDRLHG